MLTHGKHGCADKWEKHMCEHIKNNVPTNETTNVPTNENTNVLTNEKHICANK